MHDLDRVFLEMDPTYSSAFAPGHPAQETIYPGNDAAEYDNEDEYAYEPEVDYVGMREGDLAAEEFEDDSELAEELELAAELLAAGTQEEMDYFFGKIFKKAFRGLKKIAKRALPVVASALGGPLGGIAAKLITGEMGTDVHGELAGLSDEDARFERARQFVRMASSAVQEVATSSNPNLTAAARQALRASAATHMPGLLRVSQPMAAGGQRGTWIRKGSNIILMGV
ncbi:MAG: hypothetical protein HUU55_05040 [Myxococcales bacterium]|nr:hypothetical protein [Myxococcales bacterium]